MAPAACFVLFFVGEGPEGYFPLENNRPKVTRRTPFAQSAPLASSSSIERWSAYSACIPPAGFALATVNSGRNMLHRNLIGPDYV